MRQRRHWEQWFAGAIGLALVFVMALADTAPALGAPAPSPSSAASPSASPSPTQSPSASPIESPSPSAGFVCDVAFAQPEGSDHIVRGGTVRVRFEGFPPSAAVTLIFDPWLPEPRGPIGTSVADASGQGIVDGVIPIDAPIGEAQLRVVSIDCQANVYILVIGSLEAMQVDDDTVVPGQRVTVTASGFLPDSMVHLTIDTHPTQGECFPSPCREIGRAARTSADGSVVIRMRIPADVAPGVHGLFANGYSPDGFSDFTVGTEITVVPTRTLPPTDTE